jgi:XRE family transcriptional regulator, fatty acid utilization regulator
MKRRPSRRRRAKITRPESARPPTIASRGSWLRSQCSFPECTRTVTDLAHRMIYLPQPEAGQHDSRALAVQALGHVVLDHQVPRDYAAFLEQRVEINYFAAALLIPERGALTLLRKAKAAKDIAI